MASFFFKLRVQSGDQYNDHFDAIAWIHAKALVLFTHHQCKCEHSKRAKNVLVL